MIVHPLPFNYSENVETEDELGFFIWHGEKPILNFAFTLDKPNTSLTLYGILLGDKENACQINIEVIHKAINTKSKIILRGVLTQKSSIQFNGNTHIEHGAKGTNAWLECRFLVLSNQAKGQAIPALEILENDIQAGHASTAGKINDMEMFYLQSRGLSSRTAKKLIADGFLQTIVRKMPASFQDMFLTKYKDFTYD